MVAVTPRVVLDASDAEIGPSNPDRVATTTAPITAALCLTMLPPFGRARITRRSLLPLPLHSTL